MRRRGGARLTRSSNPTAISLPIRKCLTDVFLHFVFQRIGAQVVASSAGSADSSASRYSTRRSNAANCARMADGLDAAALFRGLLPIRHQIASYCKQDVTLPCDRFNGR
jgi:hypothetical protein